MERDPDDKKAPDEVELGLKPMDQAGDTRRVGQDEFGVSALEQAGDTR